MIYNPKVSIVIPVYNGSNYLSDAIDSALAQTYKNIEIIVINDGSNDNGATEKIAKSYGNKIRYFKKENGGVATALNLGIEKMSGEYFSWLSHDDMYKPNKVAVQIKRLSAVHKNNVVIASDAEVLFENGMILKTSIDKESFNYFDIFLATSARVGLNGCSLLIPRNAFLACGLFNPKLKLTQDYDMWQRLSSKYTFELAGECLVVYRRHTRQDSAVQLKGLISSGDLLRYNLINLVSEERYAEYFNAKKLNIRKYEKNCKSFLAQGFAKSSIAMLVILCRYCKSHNLERNFRRYSKKIKIIINGYIAEEYKNKLAAKISRAAQMHDKSSMDAIIDLIPNDYVDKYLSIELNENKGYLKSFKDSIQSEGLFFTLKRTVRKALSTLRK